MKIKKLSLYITSLYKMGLVVRFKSPQMRRVGNIEHIDFGETRVEKDFKKENSIHNYFEDLESENYGLMLCDGGLVQLSYSLKEKSIVSHRYCYIPSPVFLRNSNDQERELDTISFILENTENLLLRSRIRFDFEKDGEFEKHPESHLTLISPDCRIALRGGLDVKRFLRFIFLNFVNSSLVANNSSYFKNDNYDLGTLSDEWARELHFNWKS